jgi:hypothetical protein
VFKHAYELEPVCSLAYVRSGSDFIGVTPIGVKMFGYLGGGEVTGPRIQGKVRPLGGGDWGTLRSDDVIDIDARLVIETHDAAMIYVTYFGVVMLEPGSYDKLLRGELHGTARLRTTPRMYTAHPSYGWVNKVQFLGIGVIDFDERARAVTYDYFAIG